MNVRLDDIAARVAAGGRPTDRDAEALVASHDLVTIGMLADDCRRRRHGRRATYVRVAHYPVGPQAPAPGAAVPPAAREVRIGGAPPSLAVAVGTVRALAALAGGRPVTGFSLAELDELASREGVPLGDLARRLRDAGLEAIADVPVDRLAGAARAVEAVRAAGLQALTLTVHRVDEATRLETIRQAVALQTAAGGFRAFAPLARDADPEAPSTGYDDVKQVALARLLADNIESIQIDWRGYGPKLAQVALTVGADDVDGVAPADADALGARRSPLEEIRRNIRAAALDPVERDGRFAVIDA